MCFIWFRSIYSDNLYMLTFHNMSTYVIFSLWCIVYGNCGISLSNSCRTISYLLFRFFLVNIGCNGGHMILHIPKFTAIVGLSINIHVHIPKIWISQDWLKNAVCRMANVDFKRSNVQGIWEQRGSIWILYKKESISILYAASIIYKYST